MSQATQSKGSNSITTKTITKAASKEGTLIMQQAMAQGSGDKGGLDLNNVLEYLTREKFDFVAYIHDKYPGMELAKAMGELKPYIRQGDVFFKRHHTPEQIASVRKIIADECNPVKGFDGIAKLGTSGGHSHRFLHPQNVACYESVEGKRFYDILAPTILVHEEHIKLLMPATEMGMGILEQTSERELNPIENAIVEVQD